MIDRLEELSASIGVGTTVHELEDLRPAAPGWLKGVVLSELALLFLVIELGVISQVAGAPGVSPLHLVGRGVLVVVPFGALVGGLAHLVRRYRTFMLTLATLVLLGVAGLAVLSWFRQMASLERLVAEVAFALALLVVPVGLAAALFVRWTPARPANVDVDALVRTFE